jgi:hypothetical protein
MKPLPNFLTRCPPADDAELREREQALKVVATLGVRRKVDQRVTHAKRKRTKRGLIDKLHETERDDGGKKGEEQTEEQSRKEATPSVERK